MGPQMRLDRAHLTLRFVLTAWRGKRMVFITKASRNEWTSPKNFRSISLTSFLFKTVERLVDRYIRDKVLISRLLHKDVYAYKVVTGPKRPLAERLTEVMDNWRKRLCD